MLPWHIPLESLPHLKAKKNNKTQSTRENLTNINIHENPCEEMKTSIMCDISYSTREPTTVQRLISSGMTIARINIRDLEPNICNQIVQSLRQAVYNYSTELSFVYPLAIAIDICGPEIVTGELKCGQESTVELHQNNMIRLTIDPSWQKSGTAECLYVGWDQLVDLKVDDTIFIDSLTDNKVKLIIKEVGEDSIECFILVGGIIGQKMPVRVSQIPTETAYTNKKNGSVEDVSDSSENVNIFEHIEEQISWSLHSEIDALFIRNTQTVHDIRNIKQLLGDKGKHLLIIACLDTTMALDNIDEILKESDGVYIDRCVLCTNFPIEKIFIAQKQLFAKCNALGKPCICKAVINEHMPTLCVSDIANLVIDGAHVISLELPEFNLAASKYISHMIENCLVAAGVICRNAERLQFKTNDSYSILPLEDPTVAVCLNAVQLASNAKAVVIICMTNSGRTAKLISHRKPSCPVIAVTRTCFTARQLRFWRGVSPLHYFEQPKSDWVTETDARIQAALDYCKIKQIVKPGDAYVTVVGSRRGSGYCDSVRLLYASTRETIVTD